MKKIDNERLKEISIELSAYFNLNAKHKVTVSRETLIIELRKRGLSNPNRYTKSFIDAGFIQRVEKGYFFPKKDLPIYYRDIAFCVMKVLDGIRNSQKRYLEKKESTPTNSDVVEKIANFVSNEINKNAKIVKSITVVFD